MKSLYKITFLAFIGITMFSCKKEATNKKTTASKQKIETEISKKVLGEFSFTNATNVIQFTAYKTTEKKPVKGVFKKVEITNNHSGNTIKEAINGTAFKIPVSAIETNDSGRNYKIQKFFFGIMKNSLNLTGKIKLTDETNGSIDLTMNEVTQSIPFSYTIKDNTFSMKSTIDIDKWNARNAIESLNTVCKDLHKGKDGISKTWSEVAIELTSTFK